MQELEKRLIAQLQEQFMAEFQVIQEQTMQEHQQDLEDLQGHIQDLENKLQCVYDQAQADVEVKYE